MDLVHLKWSTINFKVSPWQTWWCLYQAIQVTFQKKSSKLCPILTNLIHALLKDYQFVYLWILYLSWILQKSTSYILPLSLSECRTGVWAEAEVAKFVHKKDSLSLKALVSTGRRHHPNPGFCTWWSSSLIFSWHMCLLLNGWSLFRSWEQRSRKQAWCSPQGSVSGRGPCHQTGPPRGTPRKAPSYPPASWMTSNKLASTLELQCDVCVAVSFLTVLPGGGLTIWGQNWPKKRHFNFLASDCTTVFVLFF